jgi:hypothetical protein
MDFALRASLRLSKFAPGELVFGGAKKSTSPRRGETGKKFKG